MIHSIFYCNLYFMKFHLIANNFVYVVQIYYICTTDLLEKYGNCKRIYKNIIDNKKRSKLEKPEKMIPRSWRKVPPLS
jgi:hypothetical protein